VTWKVVAEQKDEDRTGIQWGMRKKGATEKRKAH
jgi:hypothetical protein